MTIEEIKQYLKKSKMTYKDLAQICNVPESTLKNLFSGATKNPRIDTMQAIEKALGLIEENKDNQNAKEYLTDDEKQLLKAYRSLIPSMKEHLLSMAESLSIAEIARKKNNLA